MSKQLVGIIGSGRIARDPFDPAAYSGSARVFFTELKRQGRLQRAFGVEVPAWKRYPLMARNFHPQRIIWREHFYMDLAYRNALTREIRKKLEPDDFACDWLHVGAMYNVASLARGDTRCFSYHDGNIIQLTQSPYAPKNLDPRRIERTRRFEMEVVQGCAKIFTMSDHLKQSFIRDFDMPAERIEVIGAGINLDPVPEPIADKHYDNREVLFIGIDFPRKGGPQLLEAFRGVTEKYPDATLHLVGPKELAIPVELSRGVQYHGFLSKSNPEDRVRLDALFRRSSLFVMPSLYEPFGIAPLEAMVYQMPAIVTNAWALRELVTPGDTGDLVEAGSVDDLRDKLIRLLGDPAGLKRMGETGREFALGRFTWEKVIQRILHAVDAA